MVLYLRVTKDRYELPLAVADTPKELGEICGVSPGLISSCISHAEKKGFKSEYRRVILSEDDL